MATTIADVAKRAGVGVGTVSRVLNGGKSVNEKTKEAVLKAIEELNYSPNSMAKKLREQKNGVIALMIPLLYHPYFAKLADCVEREASQYGYSVMLVSTQQHVEKEDEMLERINRREVDGAIIVTHYEHSVEQTKGCPLVAIDRHLGEDVPFVTSDNYEATKKAVRYLFECGCKNVAYLGTKPIVDSEVLLREKAYRDALAAYGKPVKIINESRVHGDEKSIVDEFFDNIGDTDGVFVSGCSTAGLLCGVAEERGIKIPEQLQVVAYDGSFKQWSTKQITCMEQPLDELSRSAVKLLIDKIHGKPTPLCTMHECSFIVGTTTK